MIVIDDEHYKGKQSQSRFAPGSPAGPSNAELDPPPPFQDIEEDTHLLVDYSHNEQDLESSPPTFSEYSPEFFDAGNGNVVSHDPHLNTDGEALYRFLLSQAQIPPNLSLHVRGTHNETRHRTVARHSNGKAHTHHESYTDTVVDFDFTLNLNRYVLPNSNVHWSAKDGDPAYRGRMVKDIMDSTARKATRKERRAFRKWLKRRDATGLPPWVCPDDLASPVGATKIASGEEAANVLRSSKTLRQWADEYCASPKHLKEFVYLKIIYGWNLEALETAIRKAIMGATLYSGTLTVSFSPTGNKIYIRPDNRLSRMLSNKWLRVLSIILLIFPFVWLFKRFHRKGGGRWEVCGGAYAVKKMGRDRQMLGIREVDWLKEWEGTILEAVHRRYESYVPIEVPTPEATKQARGPLLDV